MYQCGRCGTICLEPDEAFRTIQEGCLHAGEQEIILKCGECNSQFILHGVLDISVNPPKIDMYSRVPSDILEVTLIPIFVGEPVTIH